MKSLKLAIPALLVAGLSLGMAPPASAKHGHHSQRHHAGSHFTLARLGHHHRQQGYRCHRPEQRYQGNREWRNGYTRHSGYRHSGRHDGDHDGHRGRSPGRRHIGYTGHH